MNHLGPFLPLADQKTFGSRPCPVRLITDLVVLMPSHLMAHGVGSKDTDNSMSRAGTDFQSGLVALHQRYGWFTVPALLSETPLRRKVTSIPHDVIGRSSQLVGHRAVSYHLIDPLHLPVVVASHSRVIAPG